MKRKGLWLLVGIVALVTILYFAASWYFSSIIINQAGQTLEAQRDRTGEPAEYGLPLPEDITIDTGDVTLTGWYFDNPSGANCGMMFMHGFTGTRYESLYWAPMFWERGCDLLAYDHRGHGASTPAFHTYGFHEKQDALAALNWFAQRSGLDPSRIGIGGVSYGAATALQLAPMVPEAPFVLADSTYRTLPAILTVQSERLIGVQTTRLLLPGALWVAGLRANFDPDQVSPEASIAEAQMPILIMHSRTDDFTPYTHSEAVYANSDQSRTVLHVNDWGAPHAADIVTDFGRYRELLEEFLAKYAPDFGRSPVP